MLRATAACGGCAARGPRQYIGCHWAGLRGAVAPAAPRRRHPASPAAGRTQCGPPSAGRTIAKRRGSGGSGMQARPRCCARSMASAERVAAPLLQHRRARPGDSDARWSLVHVRRDWRAPAQSLVCECAIRAGELPAVAQLSVRLVQAAERLNVATAGSSPPQVNLTCSSSPDKGQPAGWLAGSSRAGAAPTGRRQVGPPRDPAPLGGLQAQATVCSG